MSSTSRAARAVLVVALVLASTFTRPDAIEAQSVMGAIQGTVVDQSGAVLPGATVTVTNSGTGLSRTSVTDAGGTYRAELLPVGVYEVAAELTTRSTCVARSFAVAIQPIFEVFNLSNADNIIVVNSALHGVNTATNVLTPNAGFGQPTTTAGQRIIQLAVRFTF